MKPTFPWHDRSHTSELSWQQTVHCILAKRLSRLPFTISTYFAYICDAGGNGTTHSHATCSLTQNGDEVVVLCSDEAQRSRRGWCLNVDSYCPTARPIPHRVPWTAPLLRTPWWYLSEDRTPSEQVTEHWQQRNSPWGGNRRANSTSLLPVRPPTACSASPWRIICTCASFVHNCGSNHFQTLVSMRFDFSHWWR